MKINILIAIAVSILLASSCTEIPETEEQQIVYNDSSATTGQLIVHTIDKNSYDIEGAYVYLYLTYEDIARNLHVLTVDSRKGGIANFGYINIGNYYLTAIHPGKNIADTAIVQIRSQQPVTKNIILQ